MEHRGRMNREDLRKTIYAICCFKRLSRSASKKRENRSTQIELPEEYQEELDWKLRHIKKNDVVTAVFFFKGEYLQKKGMVS
ncbi:MAG: YolD-like family protein [Coprococcus comes]